MGRSKFPGKPSKLVNKKRVSVLQASEINYENDEYSSNDQISLWNSGNGTTTTFSHDGDDDDVQSNPVSQAREKPPSSEPPDGGGKHTSHHQPSKTYNTGVVTRARNTSQSIINNSSSTSSTTTSVTTTTSTTAATITTAATTATSSLKSDNSKKDKPVKKKTVTFKNILETSDDAGAVKKVYNPDNAPLVPIIKKECLSRSVRLARSDCIVRPSRLTEILKNNANKIDKLNFLKFRSSPTAMDTNVPSITAIAASTTLTATTTVSAAAASTVPTAGTAQPALAAAGSVSALSGNNNDDNNHENSGKSDTTSLRHDNVVVGDKRFILPKRSAHSCRVIKPNKRFLDDIEIFTKTNKKSSAQQQAVNSSSKKQAKKSQQQHQQQQLSNETESLEENKSQRQARPGSAPAQQESFINNTLSLKINSSKLSEEDGADIDDDLSETSHVATDDTHSDLTEEDDDDEAENNKIYRSSANPFSASPKSLFLQTTHSKVILRQPRLQFDSQMGHNQPSNTTSNTLNSSPFSLNLNNNIGTTLGSMNSNVCGVCASLVNSKSLQQSRKYGIFSCETCRKFISKTIKKSASAGGSPQTNNMLQCVKGDGNCIISPLLKGSIKNFKKTYKERCPACWLKKCIKAFHVPSGFKNRLSSIIPASLRDSENNNGITATLNSFSIKKENLTLSPSSTTTNSTPLCPLSITTVENTSTTIGNGKMNNNLFASPPSKLLAWASTATDVFSNASGDSGLSTKTLAPLNPLTENNTTFGGSPLIKPTILEKPVFMLNISTSTTIGSFEHENIQPKQSLTPTTTATATSNSPSSSAKISHTHDSPDENNIRTKLRRKDRENPPASVTTEPPKRQRIDLKGPRVKHVCRSASIVLGQPIATFPNEITSPLDSMDTPPRPESPNNVEVELPSSIIEDQTQTLNCSTCTQNPADQDLGLSPPATPIEDTRIDDENTNTCDKPFSSVSELTSSISYSDFSSSSGNSAINSMAIVDKENKKLEDLSKPSTRKVSRPALVNNNSLNTNQRNLNSFSKKFIPQTPSTPKSAPVKVSIDFWENYDPAEVSQTGFGLIFTESIPMRALCFLCGSTGLDPLIFCACCCEPYHQYCVEDEYNLKHSSLDDTMISLLDTSVNPLENMNIITNRLNWLCPRCTVCYTCSMSSGSKVKCQKCQKNYHTTCLGTSKRLLGADRPLICANCLKCKSCGTTKVSKFVGNLPMCSQCFKLRKKGNFCPLCQKCYEDNDFDLKMMECGDCQRWVHAKCEGLSDEQYNMLSTLPENIEFICKKCSRTNNQSNLWRDAVAAEFKAGLLSVVKLLSKSRPACALLRLSPRKKASNCICQPQSFLTARCLQFKKNEDYDSKTIDEESQNSEDTIMEDVYEFKDTPPTTKCYCGANQKQLTSLSVPSLVDIKRRVNSGDYISLAEFNYDMNNVITSANCDELMITYKEILSEAFPWFQNETKACTDALEEDMFDACTFSQSADGMECDQQVPVIDLPEDIEDCLYSQNIKEDTRQCMFCKRIGEGESDQESRLLYCGHNAWVHINCAMWSAEVFEEIDGSLQNVHSAIARGRMTKCTACSNRGATVGCNAKSCGVQYHFPCARKTDCAFMTDKTVYCPEHLGEIEKRKIAIEKNFEVLRPVYVELDRKKKKLVEPSKVQFLIGSLEVKRLGKILTKLSDTNEALIPIDFLCTRLYWSIKEPWKVVEYTVKTSVQNNILSLSNDAGRNFTVDHSNNINMVQFGLAQIARWHNSLMLGDENDAFFRQERSMKQLLEAVGQNLNSEEATEEEPQNNADLLPPEIKDAIFEDLPHEIFDGISMLDIFPKLMIYEDMIAIDPKSDANEYTKDGVISEEEEKDTPHKEFDLSNGWPINTGISHVEDALLSAVRPIGAGREIKRSKSEVFSRGIGGSRQQRSSSLTWSCKLDNNSKRRKISKGLQDIRLPEGILLSMGRRKEDFSTGLERRRASQNEDCKTKTFTWSAAKKYTQQLECTPENNKIDLPDKLKISQLDGMDDLTNESDFGEFQKVQTNVYDPNSSESPVKCDRCNCTYRTHDSYQRHLATCEPLSASESESETASRSPGMQSPLTQQQQPIIMQNFNQGMPITMTGTNGNIQNFGHATNIPTIQNVQIQNGIPISQLNQGISNIFLTTTQNNTQQQTTHQTIAPTNGMQQQFFPTVQNINQTVNNINQFTTSPAVSSSSQTISISTSGIQQQPQILTMSTADGNQQVLTIGPNQIISTGNRNTYQKPQILQAPTKIPKNRQIKIQQSPNKGRNKPTNATKPIQSKKKNDAINEQQQQQQSIQILNSGIPIVRSQGDQQGIVLQQNNNSQPIIVQQVGNTGNNLVQYVTDGHNSMQYITMPNSNEFKQPQNPFLSSPLVQGAFLQTDSSGNLVLTNTSSGLQMLSTAPLQLTQQTQPQVIGTLIQPQTAGIQCGVMSAEQMVLGHTPTLEMVTNPTMLLTSQPVYYGLETIVQNTVMSSQQFVSTAMQGVLSQNASFSATTTQVFQASKIEPIMEVPAGYVVLNNVDGTIMQQPTTQTNIISTNVLQQPMQQIQQQQIHTQAVQPQQINAQQIQPIYNIQQQQPQQQHTQQQITSQPTLQAHHIQPHLRAMSPAKPTAKSSPIVVTKIQPQIINKVVPVSTNQGQIIQEQKTSNPIILSKTVTITPAVETNPIFVQTAATGGNNNVPKVIKSTPISIVQNHPLKPKMNLTNSNPSLMPIQPVQRKMNMIRPLNKVSSVTIKPKMVTKPVSAKTSPNGKGAVQSPPLIAPKPQGPNMHSQQRLQQQIITRGGGGQIINEQQLLEARKNLQTQLVQPDSTVETIDQRDLINGALMSQVITTTVDDITLNGISANNPAQNLEISSSNCNLYQQPQQQQNNVQYTLATSNQPQPINLPTSSSSIMLPSAPFISPYGNNIPTNIVNPIQQVNNQNTNTVSRPTNRVLPMQTIQQKMSPPTPPELKLCESKQAEKDVEQVKDFKDAISDVINNTFDLIDKTDIIDIPQNEVEDHIIHRDEDLNQKVNEFLSPHQAAQMEVKPLKSLEECSQDNLDLLGGDPDDNDFDMKTDSDGVADQDDMSESTTPEVKEKICEILENLENEECNKNSLLDENFNQSEAYVRSQQIIEAKNNELMEQHKENVNPMPEQMVVENCKMDSISPMKPDYSSNILAHKPSGPRLLYEIQSEDGFTYKSTSITEIWEKVFEAVQVARKAHGLAPLPEGPLADMCGVQMLGLKTNALRYLIEQLPGVERCTKYTPKYHRPEQSSSGYSSDQEDLKESYYGSARCEPFMKRSEYDMFSWLASRHRKQPIQVVVQTPDTELIPRRGTGSNLPMAMKYRTLKETYKDYVGVFRSHIHGRGLYCTKDIESGEMVIEYAGELIRSTLTDKRERYYDSKGIGCYMFKIDENLVVDATMRGNAARFINHSCEPNCYSKVVDILGHKHIIIFALRRIVQGEELTYDYKFPFEDVKIPCSCGSKKCRKYLN